MAQQQLLQPMSLKAFEESTSNSTESKKLTWLEQFKFSYSAPVKGETFKFDVYLEAKAFDSDQCINWFKLLLGIPEFWQQLEAHHPGRTSPVPRLSALCSQAPVGEELQINQVLYTSVRPPALISELWLKICEKLNWKQEMGHVVALRFRDGTHSVGYHNWEPEEHLADTPGVAYLWLGQSRPVLFRNASQKVTRRFTFMDGTLFVTLPESWNDWQIQVPKSKSCHNESILLIFK